jgi:hypothetical protein
VGVCEHKNEELQQCELGLWASVGGLGIGGGFLIDGRAKKPRVALKWKRAWHPWGPRAPPLIMIERPHVVCV